METFMVAGLILKNSITSLTSLVVSRLSIEFHFSLDITIYSGSSLDRVLDFVDALDSKKPKFRGRRFWISIIIFYIRIGKEFYFIIIVSIACYTANRSGVSIKHFNLRVTISTVGYTKN